jgi:hypothetical protein
MVSGKPGYLRSQYELLFFGLFSINDRVNPI